MNRVSIGCEKVDSGWLIVDSLVAMTGHKCGNLWPLGKIFLWIGFVAASFPVWKVRRASRLPTSDYRCRFRATLACNAGRNWRDGSLENFFKGTSFGGCRRLTLSCRVGFPLVYDLPAISVECVVNDRFAFEDLIIGEAEGAETVSDPAKAFAGGMRL